MAVAGINNRLLIHLIDKILFCFFAFPMFIEKTFSGRKRLQIRKILIIELWGIGDLIMASSIFKPLKKNIPGIQISLLSKGSAKALFSGTDHIDKFFIFNFPWTHFSGKYRFWKWDWLGLIRVIKALHNEHFDLILDARGDIRNNFLSFLAGGKERIGYNWTGGGFFLTDALDGFRKNHRVDAWLNLLNYMKIDFRDSSPSLYVTEQEEKWQEDFYKTKGISNKDLLIGIHPGAGRRSRCWSLVKFIEIAKYVEGKYKAKVCFFIDPDEDEKYFPLSIGYTTVKPTLRQLLALIKRVDLFVCNDSGPMHIAVALKRPVIAIVGPGDFKRLGPYGNSHYIVAESQMSCRPCFDYCRFDRQLCLEGISVKDVAEKIDHAIKDIEYASI